MEAVQEPIPRLAGLVFGLMLIASSCQSDPTILEQALDPGTATPTEEPSPAALPSHSPTPSASPIATEVPGRTVQTPEPTETPTPTGIPVPELPTETPDSRGVKGPGAYEGRTVYFLDMPEVFLPGDSRLEGEPFVAIGAMPSAIIASTVECDIVSVDSQTGAVRVLADFSAQSEKARVFSGCSDLGTEYQEYTGTAEIPPGYIEDVEWIEPKYVLIGVCCEPAGGRFDVLDIEEYDQPYMFGPTGSYPAVNSRGELLFSTPALSEGLASFGIVQLDLDDDASGPSSTYLEISGEISSHYLALGEGEGSDPNSFATRTSWVEGDVIALGVWTVLDDQGFFPWVLLIDLNGGPVAANARGSGWMLPTADQFGNFVVVEQHCFLFNRSQCIGSPSKVVVVDSETLVPLYEVEAEDTIVDMDLVRGWLLITLVDGRMGTLDLSDGTFNVLADGIRNAVWQE